MPSKMLASISKALTGAGSLRRQAKALAKEAGTGLQTISIRGPFSGLTPDIDPNLLDGTSFSRMTNAIARAHGADHGEVLGLPDGYRQVDSASLPLGDTSPPSATGAAVMRLDQLARFSPTEGTTPGEFVGQFILTPMAVTAGSGVAQTGFMYRINASGQWTYVAPSASMSAATRQLSATKNGRTPESPSLPDSCSAPFGCPVASRPDNNTAAPGTDLQSGAINEPCWIYTNDKDEVMVFPSSTALTNAGTHAYEPLVDSTTSVDLDSGGANGFKAKSVETWNGRVYFLNTSEAGTRRSQRLRRSAKFTAHPNTAIVGSGHYDFRDFQGEGLRIETLGDVLAVYFSDGVAFIRPTGVPTSPDEPQIISTERGLISTHSVTSIGRNVHFGIFTDGWWLLDQSGRWQEVGIANINNKAVPKWRETFYDLLDTAGRHRLYVYYDQPSNMVYIALPTAEEPDPTQVWVYDPTSDRVFVENYSVTCFGTVTPLSQAGTVIDALTGTIDNLSGVIDSYSAVPGFPKVRVHGDLAGFVYSHRKDISGYHSASTSPIITDPSWSFSLGLRSPAGTRNLTTVDRVSVEYFNHDNAANATVSLSGSTADGTQSESFPLNQGGHEEAQVKDYWFRYTSRTPGVTVSGTGEYHVRGIEADVFLDPLEPRR